MTSAVVGVVASAAASEPEGIAEEEAGEQGDASDHDAHDQGEADVVVPDVGHLVAQYALQFLAVHLLQEATGHGNRRVLRVASGREGVGRRVVDDVDARHWYPGGRGHLTDDVVELRRLFGCDFLGV